jgi:hypothetical protein
VLSHYGQRLISTTSWDFEFENQRYCV